MKRKILIVGIIVMTLVTNFSFETIGEENNGSLSGIITNEEMEPIHKARITINCGNLNFTNYSNENGYYNFDNIPIVDCYWNISIYKCGYKMKYYELSIDENTIHDFVLFICDAIYVDDDNTEGPWVGSQEYPYQFIQDGIDNASDGDTVIVSSGIYFENLVVEKSICLIGENRDTTVIDGSNKKDVVKISRTDEVTISGFTIQKCGEFYSGIYVYRSANGFITNNLILDNQYGIYVYKNASNGLSHTTISDNIILRSDVFGVWLYKSSHNIVSNNIINDGGIYGIGLCFWSTDSIVNGNTISNNNVKGIVGRYVYNNEIYENIIENNGYGIHFMNAVSNNTIYNNHIKDNIMYGISLENISTHNIIEHNNFIDNIPNNAFFIIPFSTTNKWNNNYWDKSRVMPYPIFGYIQTIMLAVPWLNIDWNPAKEPYEI